MKNVFLVFIAMFSICNTQAQNVGIGTTTPDTSALLHVNSSNKGFLPPRMTEAERNAIYRPAIGLMVYCTNCAAPYGELQSFNGNQWVPAAGTVPSLPTTNICNQTWSAKNLDVSFYRNGDSIPKVTGIWGAGLTTGAWCWYNNDSANYAAYGKLYNWYAVNDPRGLAPAGWHVPTETEWQSLETCLGGTLVAGQAMKESFPYPHWNVEVSLTYGTNTSGFNAFGSGKKGAGILTEAWYWSATQNTSTSAFYRTLISNSNNENKLLGGSASKGTAGFSVRLIKDLSVPVPTIGAEYQGGKIFYILQSGDPGYVAGETHGFIAASSDQLLYSSWGCEGTTITGADGTALGTGYQNTNDIVPYVVFSSGTTRCQTPGIAARVCVEFVLNGYSDWYLPSRDELGKLWINRLAVGGYSTLSGSYYWSSSEASSTDAVSMNFFSNNLFFTNQPKSSIQYVRPIRRF